jgi:HD-GYP domain-containing protein (c-di-GMP phosphodiesterase class II)
VGIECSQLLEKQRRLFLNTIQTLAQIVEHRDSYTGGHIHRVTQYALLLGKQLGLPAVSKDPAAPDLNKLEVGTPLHDIGKIYVPDSILNKPARLTEEEFDIMKQHTTKGAAIVSNIPDLHPIIPIVKNHHERWDGNGYPDGLKGEEIPLLARIVTIVDAFDAMTSVRVYHTDKQAKPLDFAFGEIQKMAGLQFDPQCAAAFLAIREQVEESMKTENETAVVGAAARSRPA